MGNKCHARSLREVPHANYEAARGNHLRCPELHPGLLFTSRWGVMSQGPQAGLLQAPPSRFACPVLPAPDGTAKSLRNQGHVRHPLAGKRQRLHRRALPVTISKAAASLQTRGALSRGHGARASPQPLPTAGPHPPPLEPRRQGLPHSRAPRAPGPRRLRARLCPLSPQCAGGAGGRCSAARSPRGRVPRALPTLQMSASGRASTPLLY